ncbi:MAG: nicotinamide-nucleotide amidase [Limisphaerales bacterium]|jgi:nicotinamide-nucleotide amidase
MEAVLITIGDEILIGRTIDTNSAWMGSKLSEIGVNVLEIVSISDSRQAILDAVDQSLKKADLVLVTGGLGPTRDDITKKTLADYYDLSLVSDPGVQSNLERLFKKWGREIPELSKSMALVPEGCKVLINDVGTAAGMWFDRDQKVLVSMPGVPHEMKDMMRRKVLPLLQTQFKTPFITHRHIMTAGIGESRLAAKIEDLEDTLPAHVKLAYLPTTGMVKMRLSGTGENQEAIKKDVDDWTDKIATRLEKYVYGFDEMSLSGSIVEILKARNIQLGLAESCTGGLIASKIVQVPGCSKWFRGGLAAYSYEAKESLLGVSRETLNTQGAVSEECINEMLDGALKVFNADCAIAVSGIAGPDGGTESKPVGTVYIGVEVPGTRYIHRFTFPGNREMNINLSAAVGLNLLSRLLRGHSPEVG